MKITVTQEDIEKGTRRHPDKCALALAISQAKGSPWCVGGHLTWDRATNSPVVHLPKIAEYFECQFDAGDIVQPFEFELP